MRHVLVATVGVFTLLLASSAEAQLTELPEPFVENFEQGVRDQIAAARDAVERLLASSPEPNDLAEGLGQLGALLLLYDFMDEAKTCLVEARRLDPDDYRWHYYLAVTETYTGESDAALASLEEVLQRRPEDVAALIRSGELFLKGRDHDAAHERFARALELMPTLGAAKAGLGKVAIGRDDPQTALPLLEEALASQPDATILHYHLGVAYRKLGDRERAREELAKPRKGELLFPDPLMDQLYAVNVSREAFFSRGIDALTRGKPELAIQAFERVIEAHPQDAEAHYNVGMALIDLQRQAEGEAYLRKAVLYRDDYRDAHFNLGLVLARRGADEEATKHLGRAVEIDPLDHRARVHYGTALERIGDRQQAISTLRSVLEDDGALAPARLSLGAILTEEGDIDGARAQLEAVLELAPGAVKERAEAHLRLGILEAEHEASGDALAHYRKATELDPEFVEAQRNLAFELARREAYVEAAVAFDRVLALDPSNEQGHVGRAMALLLGSDYPRARTALDESTGQLPQSLLLSHLLARFLATAPDAELRNGEEAVRRARRAFQLSATAEHAATLAMAYAEIGEFENAIRYQTRVVTNTTEADRPQQQARLELYEAGTPVREPWRTGER